MFCLWREIACILKIDDATDLSWQKQRVFRDKKKTKNVKPNKEHNFGIGCQFKWYFDFGISLDIYSLYLIIVQNHKELIMKNGKNCNKFSSVTALTLLCIQ